MMIRKTTRQPLHDRPRAPLSSAQLLLPAQRPHCGVAIRLQGANAKGRHARKRAKKHGAAKQVRHPPPTCTRILKASTTRSPPPAYTVNTSLPSGLMPSARTAAQQRTSHSKQQRREQPPDADAPSSTNHQIISPDHDDQIICHSHLCRRRPRSRPPRRAR